MSNLAKFLIEVRRVDKCAFLDLRVKEVFIPSDKERAEEFLHLHGYVHGHGDNKVEEDHEGEEVCKHLQILKQRQNTCIQSLQRQNIMFGIAKVKQS